MTDFEVTKECTYCWGTGNNPAYVPEGGSQADCPKCSGTGRVESGQIDDIATAFSALNTKLDVLDTKMDALDTHLDTIETKIDALE